MKGLGCRSCTAVQVGGLESGKAGSTALGSVRDRIRAETTASSTGPSTVGIEVSMLADVAGRGPVAGLEGASGTFTTDVKLRLAPGGAREDLFCFEGSGGLAGAGSPAADHPRPRSLSMRSVLRPCRVFAD